MTAEFNKEMESRIREIEGVKSKLTGFWMDGKFMPETNSRIGRSLDYMEKAIEQLELLKS